MRRLNNSGFTIIETTLVLAISGALIGALLIGTWTSINAQRYRDSVTSLESLIKQQYSDVINVSNDKSKNLKCVTSNDINTGGISDVGVDTTSGQSDCLILGKYLDIKTDGSTSVATVAGYRFDPTAASDGKEITALHERYKLFLVNGTIESSQLEWDAKIAWPVSGEGSANHPVGGREISFLMLHSPTSGVIYTFSSSTVSYSPGPSDLSAMIIVGDSLDPGRSYRNICVNSSDGLNSGMSVWVDAMAFDSSAVQIHSNDMNPADIYEAGSAFIGSPPKC